MMRKILVLSLLLVMALSFIACEGEDLPSAQDIIDNYIQALEDVRTGEFDMEMTMDIDGEEEGESIAANMEMDASGVLDIANNQMQMAMNLALTGEEDMEVEAEMYLVDNTFYILTDMLGMGPMWMKLEMSEMEELPEEYWEQADLLELPIELLEAFEVEVTGSEKVDGIDCYVLEINPDMEQLWQMFETTELEMADIPEDLEGHLDEMFRSFSVRQWIAKDTYLLTKQEIEMTMEFTPEAMGFPEEEGEAAIDLFITLLFYDYNQPVSIELPPEAENAMDIMDFMDYMDY